MKFHKKTGTLRFCFKNDDHRNLDMGKCIDHSIDRTPYGRIELCNYGQTIV